MNRGPLMNDEIHELELELELLKRKRLMVQQQQTLLASQQNYSQSRQPGFDYQQSSQQFNQQTNRRYDISQEHNQARNFSHLYDGPNQQHGLKRHAPDSSFHTNPPAKRFNGPQGGKPNKGPKGLPKPWDIDPINTLQTTQRSINQPQPLLSFEKFKKKLNFNPSMSRPAHSDFKPNKVTKPNVDNTPKYKSSPVPATRKAPATRNNPVAPSSETTKKSHYEYLLRANDTPSHIVNGRLEFAMGHILKEIRVTFESVKKYSHIFTTAPQKETIKKILRERIRCAMLDKVVGPGKDIIIEYRKMYPQHTDKEILELTLLADKPAKIPNLCIQLEDADNPKQYFTNNFHKLFDFELDKMFEKIKHLYMDENKVNTKSMQEIINDNIPTPVHVKICTTDHNATESGIKTTSNIESEPNKERATEDSKVPSDVTNADEQQDEAKLKETRSTAVIDETKPPNDRDVEMFCAWKHYNNKFFQSEFYDKLIILGIKQRLHEVLPKKKHDIMAMFEIDNMYTAAKEEIMKETTKKLDSTSAKNAEKLETPAAPEATTKPMDVSKYFVRVVGRPNLPKKKIMKEFLDKFNPTSIKKHRQLSYLLFVGFSNKEDYEKLLQANGTMLNGDQVQAEGPADVLTLSIEEVANGEPEDYIAVLPETGPRYKAVLQEPDPRPFEDILTASSAPNIKDALDISIDEKVQPEFVDASHPAVLGDIQACTNEGKVTKRRKKRGGKFRTLKRRERKKKLEEKRNRTCEKDEQEDGDQVQAEGPADVLTLSIEEVANGEPEDYKAVYAEPGPRAFENVPTPSSVIDIKEALYININEKAQPEIVDPSRSAVLGDIQASTNEGTVTKKKKRYKGKSSGGLARRKRRQRMLERRKKEWEKDRSEDGDQVQAEGPADVLTLSIEEVVNGEPEDYIAVYAEPGPRPFEDVSTASSVLNIKEALDTNIDEKVQPEIVDPSCPAVPEDIQACTNEGAVKKKRKPRRDPKFRTLIRKERRKRMMERRKREFEKDRSEENSRLLMTASDVSQSAKPCTDTNADDDVILVGENRTVDSSSDVSNIISSDLDEQITDLLSSIRKAEEISETLSANEEKDDTVTEMQEPEVINLTDDTSSIKEDSENAPAANSQMQTDDVIQERMAPGADEEPTEIHSDKLSVETKVTTESNENQNDDLNTNKQDKSDNTKPDETKNEEANNTSPGEKKEDTNNTDKEKQFVEEEKIEMNDDTNKTEEINKPTVTEETTESKNDTNGTEEKNKPTVMEEVIEIEDNDEEKTPVENKTMTTVKDTTKGTPVRASSRLANSTPSRVATRRTSKLAQQNNQ